VYEFRTYLFIVSEEGFMQVLVIYASKTGNTKKLAEAIAAGVREAGDVGCVVKPVAEVTKEDFLQSDGIIAGSPVYFGSMTAEMKGLFERFVGIRQKMGDKVGAQSIFLERFVHSCPNGPEPLLPRPPLLYRSVRPTSILNASFSSILLSV
jgi:hypothetical protein